MCVVYAIVIIFCNDFRDWCSYADEMGKASLGSIKPRTVKLRDWEIQHLKIENFIYLKIKLKVRSEMGENIATHRRESGNCPWLIKWVGKMLEQRSMNDWLTEEGKQRGESLKWLSKHWDAFLLSIRWTKIKNDVQSWQKFKVDASYIVSKLGKLARQFQNCKQAPPLSHQFHL